MSEIKPARFYTDRSAVEADDRCGMEFWLNRKEGGLGIVPKQKALALQVGGQIHEDMAALAEVDTSREALEAIIADLLKDITPDDYVETAKMERLYRRLGWIAAWGLFLEPQIRAEFENVSTEEELILDYGDLWVGVTPDRVVRHRKGGWLQYLEFKSTISTNQKWLDSWKYAIQLHTSLRALNAELAPEKVKFAQVIGLYKGYESHSDGRLVHPYVYGYFNSRTSTWSAEYKRGTDWAPRPVWEYPGGVVNWALFCGEETARLQFPWTEPIFENPRMTDEWLLRRLHREGEIAEVEELCRTDLRMRSLYFPRRTSKCRPPFGEPCAYVPICWNAEVAAAPCSHPDFEPRDPHHEVERYMEG